MNYGHKRNGLLGTLLKHTEFLTKEYPSTLDKEFVDSWKYQGKIYRVIHPHYVFDTDSTEPRTVMHKVNYHGMITHARLGGGRGYMRKLLEG